MVVTATKVKLQRPSNPGLFLTNLARILLQTHPIPLIFVPSPQVLLSYLEYYVSTLPTIRAPKPRSVPVFPTRLIAQATAGAPLSEHDASVLSELFPSIRALEEGTRTIEGREKIDAYFDKVTADSILEFWDDEWIL